MSTTAVTLFTGPGTLHCAPSLRNGNQQQGNIIFHYVLDGSIRTLSNTNSPSQESFKGLLYVPTLNDPPAAVCNNLTAPYIPTNATRRSDLPADAHDLLGLAPWVNPECTRAYLSASRQDNVSALIFYQPERRDSAKPEPSASPVWDLGDAGQWKKENEYPVYAVPGTAGTTLMHQLTQYGGGGDGSDAQTTTECTRLYALIDLEPDLSSTMPGMWVFILAVLGAIVLMVIFAFLTMRHVQKKRRESLQRRLVSGEVDLEFLGIKRLVVPPHILSALPVYVYPGAEEGDEHGASKERTENTCEETNGAKPKDTTTVTETEINDNASDNKNNNQHSNPHHPPPALTIVTSHQDESISSILEEILPPVPTRALGKRRRTVSSQTLTLTFSQHTCAICLDDFVPAESLVRELPCMHIFHPECIDTFLARDASTCPVCKQNVLPETFVEEQIGALLARREERVRRLRRRRRPRLHNRYDHEEGGPDSPASSSSSGVGVLDRFRAWLARDYDDDQSPVHRQDDEPFGSLESGPGVQRPAPAGFADTSRESEESYDPGRREMIQRRVMVLLGTPVGHRSASSLSSPAPSSEQ
ncbi:RING finger domain protein, putative [Talaromyces marneffei ATCC 18224]|uniref:RING finger domain protein, putative n=1 Tax=Talaromyces marneffei (strain ATCC 18224 / CBS 334.59 / QM 7333) TaxID=441960 RepID=B6QKK3_TALMQ|nr:RING finger domain protein, putative [Talaromyces marneffei ATCC 18224]